VNHFLLSNNYKAQKKHRVGAEKLLTIFHEEKINLAPWRWGIHRLCIFFKCVQFIISRRKHEIAAAAAMHVCGAIILSGGNLIRRELA
jgi:intein/homing endonuclease